ATHAARAGRNRAGGCHYSVCAANRSLPVENRPGDAPSKTVAGPFRHPVGQAASHAELCPEFLRGTRRVYARGAADHTAVIEGSPKALNNRIAMPRPLGIIHVILAVSA